MERKLKPKVTTEQPEATALAMPEARVSALVGQSPELMVANATALAKVLADVIEQTKSYQLFHGKKHVTVEGWTTLGMMMGVFPVVESAKRLDRDGEIAYEAIAALQTLAGSIVGRGDAMCSSTEKNWSSRDEYAIRSMAETRAVSKAFRMSFSWVTKLAGFEVTPAEELSYEQSSVAPVVEMITTSQLEAMAELVTEYSDEYTSLREFELGIQKNKPSFRLAQLTKEQGSKLIEQLKSKVTARAPQEEATAAETVSDEEMNDYFGGAL